MWQRWTFFLSPLVFLLPYQSQFQLREWIIPFSNKCCTKQKKLSTHTISFFLIFFSQDSKVGKTLKITWSNMDGTLTPGIFVTDRKLLKCIWIFREHRKFLNRIKNFFNALFQNKGQGFKNCNSYFQTIKSGHGYVAQSRMTFFFSSKDIANL